MLSLKNTQNRNEEIDIKNAGNKEKYSRQALFIFIKYLW